jgi:hypothetical protein
MRHLIFFAGLAVLAAQPVAAAPPAPAAPATARIDPAALAAADRLLTAMDYDGMMKHACDAMVAKMAPMLKSSLEQKTGQKVDDALIDRITGVEAQFLRQMLVNSPDVRRASVVIYATHFSAAELDHLALLYKDPVMRKWSQVGPDAAAEMLPLIQGLAESHRQELEEKVKAAVLEYYSQKAARPDS